MIRLRDVSFHFGEKDAEEVLRSITLDIHDGEWVAITGRNGSGKSTLCRLIAGLEKPTGGIVDIDGSPAVDARSRTRGGVPVGIAFQDPDSQLLTSSVRRELLFGMENIGLAAGEVETRMKHAVERFDLGPFTNRNPHTLSGGEKQRLLLACLWTMHPKHLVLDEPFSFLDGRTRGIFLDAVRDTFHRESVSVIWSTLEPFEITLADRVVYLEDGAAAYDGRPRDLWKVIPGDVLARPAVRIDSSDGAPETVPVGDGGREKPFAGSVDVCTGSRAGSGPGAAAGEGTFGGNAPAVEVSNAAFSYDEGDFVLEVEAFRLNADETVGIDGPSGSGKSTLLLACSGLFPPARGDVYVLGGRIRSLRDFPAGRVALLFQTPERGFFAPTVHDEVALGYRSYHGTEGEHEAVSEAIECVGLDPERYARRSPFRLSQGQKRLVAIASLLVMPARIFLFDEPALFLDGRARRLLSLAITRLKSRGVSLLIASHEQEFLSQHAGRHVSLCAGRMAAVT